MRARAGLIVVLIVILTVEHAAAHSEQLDPWGCHHGHDAGDYHCHQGPMRDLGFASQADMLRFLEEWHASPSGRRNKKNLNDGLNDRPSWRKGAKQACIRQRETGRFLCAKVLQPNND